MSSNRVVGLAKTRALRIERGDAADRAAFIIPDP
jgi:hypothetical protein